MFFAFVLGDIHTTDADKPSNAPDVYLAIALPMVGILVVIVVCILVKRYYMNYEIQFSEGKIVI